MGDILARPLRALRAEPRRLAILAVGVLLAAIIAAGLVGLVLNQRVGRFADDELKYDVRLENRANELRAAIIELEHDHRDLLINGASERHVEDFEGSYALVQARIDRLEEVGIRYPGLARPEEMRRATEEYYADFRPAVAASDSQPEVFAQAGDRGLRELEALESEVREIQRVAQERSEAALDRLRSANAAAQRNLIAVVVGLFLIGAALSYTIVRMVGELRSLYAREQRTTERIARSEERFRALLKNSSDIISVFEADGTVIYHSPSHQRILGYRPEERVGRNVFEVPHVHPEDFEIKRDFFYRVLASGPDELQVAEFRLRDVEGRYHVMEAVGTNRLDDPLVRGIVTNYRDVTERHQAEEQLRFQKALLESQTEASIDGILVVSEDREVLSYNRRFVEIWDIPAGVMEDRSSESVLRFVVDKVEDPEDFRERVEYLYAHPEEESHEEIPLKDGRTFDRYSAAVRSEDGVYYGRVWYFRDITERKRAEEQLRRYSALIDLSYEPIFVWDLDRGIVEWNKGCEQLYGYSKEEAAGRVSHRLLKTVHPIPLEELLETLRREGVWSGEVRHTTREGREVIVESRHQLIESQGRRLVLETNRDITERKRIEEELARSLQSKTDFLADVSHELRTPLTMIRTNAEVGLHIERDCAHIEQLEQIAAGSVRMSRLVEDLLFLARSDSASPPLELETVAIPLFLADLAERAKALAHDRGAAFEASLSGEGRIRIDPARIEQAVLILVDNAAKYGPPGEPVTLTATTAAGELRLSVEDRGPGISAEDLPHVFDRFYRGKAARDGGHSWGGTGLGLAIARTIAEAHGGGVEAANRSGGGTRMLIYLPVVPDVPDRVGAPGSRDSEATA